MKAALSCISGSVGVPALSAGGWRSVVLCDLHVLEQFWYLVKDLLLEIHQAGVILELVAEDLVDMAGQTSVDELEGPEDEDVFKGG